MPVLTRFRLDGGTNQQAARKLLPQQGLLRRVVNFDLRRDNELAVRPGFTALATGIYGQSTRTAAMHDLISYDERLFALGKMSTTTQTESMYEYVGALKAWRRVTARLPDATNLREIGAPPDVEGGVDGATCAAYNGLVCLAFRSLATTPRVLGHLFRASDNSTLVLSALSGMTSQPAALVTLAHKFHVVGQFASPATFLYVFRLDPTTDEAFGSDTLLQAVDVSDVFSAAAVASSVGGFVTVGCLAGNLVVRHYNDSYVQQMTRTINTVVPKYLAIAADGTADRIVVGYVDDADDIAKYRVIKLSDGTDVSGPTSLGGGATTDGALSVTINSAGTVHAFVNITSATPRKAVGDTVAFNWSDLQLTTEALVLPETGGDTLFLAGFTQKAHGTAFGVGGFAYAPASGGGVNVPLWFKDFATAMEWPFRLGSLCVDSVTGLYYTTSLRQNNDLEGTVTVNEFSRAAMERRQIAIQGGLLHISGALPLISDGRTINEIGWGEAPNVYALASSNSTGSITSSAEYFIQIFAEQVDARGNTHRGAPSKVYPITLGAAHDTITGELGPLHTLRASAFFPAVNYRYVICRTAALADLSAGENLYRETHVSGPTDGDWQGFVSFTLTTSDDDLRALGETQGTIYTQGQTPIAHQAPPPASYLWPTNERLAVGGLPQTNQWLQSKLKFPAEGTHFSDADLPQYQGSTDEAILAIASIQGQLAAFTRRTISLWSGEGPDESGQGSFSFTGFLTREGGINGPDGWKSLVETDEGIFFQRDDEQLCRLGHDGSVEWGIGQNVRDELVAYPVVNAACFIRKKHQVVFAVENAAGNAGELLVYDLRRKQWFIWDIWAKALAEYQGRLCYADSSGTVYQQNASAGTGALPTAFFETFDFDFGTGMSWGEILGTGIVGTKQGDCTVALDVSFDSGDSYAAVGSWATTTAGGYVTGKPIDEKKALPDRKHSRFALKVTVSGGSDTLAAYLNEIVLETETAPGMSRLPARDTQ